MTRNPTRSCHMFDVTQPNQRPSWSWCVKYCLSFSGLFGNHLELFPIAINFFLKVNHYVSFRVALRLKQMFGFARVKIDHNNLYSTIHFFLTRETKDNSNC